MARYMGLGGAIVVGYHGIRDYMRHHDEANPRPLWFDHLYTTMIMGTIGGAFVFGSLEKIAMTTFFSGMIVAPFTWWFHLNA